MSAAGGSGGQSLWRALRVQDWLHFASLPLLTLPLAPFDAVRGGLALLAAACYLALAYSFNEWNDDGLHLLSEEELRQRTGQGRTAWRLTMVALAGGCIAATVFIRWWVPLVAGIGIVGSLLYSGWVRWKAKPVIGTLANLWIFMPVCLFGGELLSMDRWLLVGAFCAVLLQSQLLHELSHRLEDAQDGLVTTTVRFGPGLGSALSVGMGLIAVALLALLSARVAGWRGWAGVAVLAGFLVSYLVWASPRAPESAHRWRLAHRYLGLVSGAVAWSGTVA